MGFPEVEDPCSKAKGRRAGSRRETDGRLMRVFPAFPPDSVTSCPMGIASVAWRSLIFYRENRCQIAASLRIIFIREISGWTKAQPYEAFPSTRARFAILFVGRNEGVFPSLRRLEIASRSGGVVKIAPFRPTFMKAVCRVAPLLLCTQAVAMTD